MGANIRLRNLSDIVRLKANLRVECRSCDHVGLLDAVKVSRWFHCHGWNDAIEVACLRCRKDFHSTGPGNRLCKAWRAKVADASPYAL